MNRLPIYNAATSTNIQYHSLGQFQIACVHCGALHFPEENVFNRLNTNSFSDCFLHGRIAMDPPQLSNELVRLFLKRHLYSDQFHKKIRNINSSFALSSFNGEDDRTTNNNGIYSFTACGQVYLKMNMTAHPTQNSEGNFESPQYGQLYY